MGNGQFQTCQHGHEMPIQDILGLPECQAQKGLHRCAVCAYNEGKAVAEGQRVFGEESEECSHNKYAPKNMLNSLPISQGGLERHKCVYHAYQLGIASVIEKSVGHTDIFDARTNIFDIGTTEKTVMAKSRIGQNIFRNKLMSYWQKTCPLTGIADSKLLRASHIKPWAKCETNPERLDVFNGLLLSSLWDAAFDSGLVSFADNGQVLTANNLSTKARITLNIESVIPLELSDKHLPTIAWHRENKFLG